MQAEIMLIVIIRIATSDRNNLLYYLSFVYLKVLLNYLLNSMLLAINSFQLVEFGKVLRCSIFEFHIIFLMLYFL